MDKKVAAGTIVAVIGAIAGGGWALSLDFSTTETNIDDHSTSIGDTITTNINTIREDMVEEATLTAICNQDVIPEEYTNTCKERESP